MEELLELRERESQWRQRLVGTSLVMEADVDQGEATESFRWLGNRFRNCDTREDRKHLLSLFRANFLIGLTAVGGRDYDEGTFWPFVNEAFGVRLSQGDTDLVVTRYKEILDYYSLRRFTTPMANVGEILMHAGVPVGSVEGFLRLLVKQDRRGAGTSGALFAAWARSQNRESASLLGLDAPTWRFLREGGEIAEDFVDRCLVAFDAATTGGISPDSGLARHIVDEIGRLVETGALVSRPGRGTRSREVVYVPTLTWDDARHGVAITLPSLEVPLEETVHWTLASEGRSASYTAEPPWPGLPAKTIIHSLRQPTKAVSVRARPGEQEWDMTVVDPDDPLLIFDAATGVLIPARNSLPRDLVVIGTPQSGDKPFNELIEFDGPCPVISEHQSPFGWESWIFATVDLNGVKKLSRGEDRARFVSTSTRPQIAYPEPVLGATTSDDSIVYSDVPSVTLPASGDSSAGSLPWTISLTEESSGRTLWSSEVRSASDPLEVELWPERPASLLGKYVITVRGALGRGLTRRVVVAEGWAARHQPTFRYLAAEGNGMEPATVSLSCADKDNQSLELDRSTPSATVTLSSEASELAIVVRVPHMNIAVTRGSTFPVVTLLPQSLDSESLEDTHLRVTVPAGLWATLGLVSAKGVEQTIDAVVTGQRSYVNFNLGQLADTARSARSGRLQLRIGEKSVPVGNLRPRKLADEVRFDAETSALVISPSAPQGLAAAIYPKYSPWKLPTVISFADGAASAAIDRAVSQMGRAKVLLRVDDPWSPSPWPEMPDRTDPNVFDLTMLPLEESDESVEGEFSRWLEGSGEMPSGASALPLAAQILSLLGKFDTTRTYSWIRSQISGLFASHPALFLDTAMQTSLEPSVLMRLVVDSDLAATGSEIPPPVPGSWPLNSFLGLVGDYEGTQEDSDPEFISNLENFAGRDALTLLDTGTDPHAKIGRFDDNTPMLSQFPVERLEQIWAAASPIPGRLLQQDTRMIAARQLFDARSSRTLRDLTSGSRAILQRTKSAIFDVLGPGGTDAIEARIGADGWRNLPALSMALAIVARLAARDLGNTRGLYAVLRDYYAQLAEAAPAFVEQDLVIAELWIMNWRNEWTR
ncbi:hypothetical protein [Salinibacterium sp. SWN248]|uniref:hypothetical protein n=1 Tax=Salinibacterium sp. SWN248 TaxID=2792056 RepID=UPI0018CD03D5|nr:hypothetical protein [Salinibacterium sp. SWN248]MBH0022651.1 hypothetical protein [Salinibacterium sp. SWN248]